MEALGPGSPKTPNILNSWKLKMYSSYQKQAAQLFWKREKKNKKQKTD